MALKQTLSFKLQQKLSPQQIQLMKLLQLPTVALEQRIKEEMESNPALDEGKENEDDDSENDLSDEYDDDNRSEAEKEFNFDDYIDDSDTPSYKLTANNHSKDDEEKHIPLSVGATFQEMLESQIVLFNLDDDDHEIALHIIGSLDDAGYLRREISAIVDDLAFTQNIITDEKHIEKIVQLIQHLDPAGVGARTLQECLLIQLKRKKNHSLITKNAQEIIEHFFEEFSKKHYAKII
ncbi:MAG: RNA polymerase sigma-54 factor, partial [Bacteroidetes bacterium HGW-Bacteroidetes-12]